MGIILFIAISLVLLLQDANGQNYKVTITITGLHSNKGKILAGIYNSEIGFPKEAHKAFRRSSFEITENRCIVVFENIPKGVYAIACFHDENNNGKMDTNFLGIPSEGTAASNNAEGFLGPPKFKDAKFIVNGDVEQENKIEY